MTDLKTTLSQIDIKWIENEKRLSNKFEWAWRIYITIPKSKWRLAKELWIKKTYEWYIYWSAWTNGALETIEDMVQEIINYYNENYGMWVNMKTILL